MSVVCVITISQCMLTNLGTHYKFSSAVKGLPQLMPPFTDHGIYLWFSPFFVLQCSFIKILISAMPILYHVCPILAIHKE